MTNKHYLGFLSSASQPRHEESVLWIFTFPAPSTQAANAFASYFRLCNLWMLQLLWAGDAANRLSFFFLIIIDRTEAGPLKSQSPKIWTVKSKLSSQRAEVLPAPSLPQPVSTTLGLSGLGHSQLALVQALILARYWVLSRSTTPAAETWNRNTRLSVGHALEDLQCPHGGRRRTPCSEIISLLSGPSMLLSALAKVFDTHVDCGVCLWQAGNY